MAHSRVSRSPVVNLAARQRLEALEARLNPPMDDDEEIVDPFGCREDGAEAERVERLRLMFHWKPASPLH